MWITNSVDFLDTVTPYIISNRIFLFMFFPYILYKPSFVINNNRSYSLLRLLILTTFRDINIISPPLHYFLKFLSLDKPVKSDIYKS
jgi:hypothetical protein